MTWMRVIHAVGLCAALGAAAAGGSVPPASATTTVDALVATDMATSVGTAVAKPGVSLTPAAVPVESDPVAGSFVPGEVIVTYDKGASRKQVATALASVDGDTAPVTEKLTGNAALVQLPKGVSVSSGMAMLNKQDGVAYAEPNYYIHTADVPNDPSYVDGSLWGMQGASTLPANEYGSDAAGAWSQGYTGSDRVYVVVIDEGIDTSHPDLASNIWTNQAEANGTAGVDDDGDGYVDDVHGFDFVNDDGSVYDAGDGEHGTHVAGTIGAVGGNGLGVAGVNWQVQLISAKFIEAESGTMASAIRAIDYATTLRTTLGLNIVATNNSWVGPGSRALQDAIKRGGNAGILFVAAAGNAGSSNDVTPGYPASYDCSTSLRDWDCVVSVASIGSGGGLSWFSQYGKVSVDIGAPGEGILSTVPGGEYDVKNGTSMATPHVTGALALCAAANRGLSEADLKDILLASATMTASLEGKTVSGGRLDVGRMLPDCAGRAEPFTGAPTNFSATAYYTDRIRLEWHDTTAGEYGHEVQIAIGQAGCAGPFTHFAFIGPGLTTYPVLHLAESTYYCFRIRTIRDQATSDWVVSNMEITWSSNLPFISGRVLLADGVTTVSRASVGWSFGDNGDWLNPTVSTLSDENGEYVLQVSPGSGMLFVSNGPGVTPVLPRYFLVPGMLTAQDDVAVDLTMPPLRQLTVRVVDAISGDPIPGARVSSSHPGYCENFAEGSGWDQWQYKVFPGAAQPQNTSIANCTFHPTHSYITGNDVVADADGIAHIAVVDDSLYQRPYTFTAQHPSNAARTASVTFSAIADADQVRIELPRTVTISGRILMADGVTPVSRVTVGWTLGGVYSPLHPSVSTVSDTNGEYALQVSPGAGTLDVTNVEGSSALPAWFSAPGMLTTQGDVRVDLTMPPMREIVVQVVDAASGDPVSGARLSIAETGYCEPYPAVLSWENWQYKLFPGAGQPEMTSEANCDFQPSLASTSVDGIARAIVVDDSLYQNLYTLTAQDPTDAARTVSVTFRATADANQLRLELPRAVTISGRVLLADGVTPVSRATVGWTLGGMYDPLDARVSTLSDEIGEYVLQVSPGAGTLVVSNGGGDSPVLPRYFISPGMLTTQDDVSVDLMMPPLRQITVRVVDAYSGDPIPGAKVTSALTGYCEDFANGSLWDQWRYKLFPGATEPAVTSWANCAFLPAYSYLKGNGVETDTDGMVRITVVDDSLYQRPYTFTAQHSFDDARVASITFRATSDQANQTIVVPGTPSRPERPSATPSETSAVLSWDEPWDGGAFIDYYNVSVSLERDANYVPVASGSCAGNIPPGQRTCVVQGLTPGTTYFFAIVAHNIVGYSQPAVYSTSTKLPQSVSWTPSKTTVLSSAASLTPSPLASRTPGDGGSISYAVTGGTASCSANAVTAVITWTSVGSCVVTATAVATANYTAASVSVTFTIVAPVAVPGAPVGIGAVPAAASAVVSWSPPVSDGGSAVSSYQALAYAAASGGPVLRNCVATAPAMSCTVAGLVNGTTYFVAVRAKNPVGWGGESARIGVTPVSALTVPSAPTGVKRLVGNAQVSVSWLAPPSDGGSTPSSYQALAYDLAVGGTILRSCTVSPPVSACTIGGLVNGTTYYVATRAKNAVGWGAQSARIASTPTAVVPGVPRSVTKVVGGGSVAVSWIAPSNDGGSAIISYQALAYDLATGGVVVRNCVVAPPATACSIMGLANETTYYLSVRAKNAVGWGPQSDPRIAVTPAATVFAPGAPTGIGVVPGAGIVAVTWTTPTSDGGAVITIYQALAYDLATGGVIVRNCSTIGDLGCTITGLANGTTYYVAVRAKNAVGWGAQSTRLSVATAVVAEVAAPTPLATPGMASDPTSTPSADPTPTPSTEPMPTLAPEPTPTPSVEPTAEASTRA